MTQPTDPKPTDDLRKQLSANMNSKIMAALATKMAKAVTEAATVKEGTFKMAIIKQADYQDRPFCPHCATSTLPEVKWVVNEESGVSITGKILGDLAICKICNQPMMILMYPILPIKTAIFLNWTIKDGEVKLEDAEKQDVPSDAGKDLAGAVPANEGASGS